MRLMSVVRSHCWLQALPYKDKFIAVGLDSSEADFPPRLFTDTYAEAAKHGLRAVAHAGATSFSSNARLLGSFLRRRNVSRETCPAA